jgi:L-cysteine S-thiosulfotransferase
VRVRVVSVLVSALLALSSLAAASIISDGMPQPLTTTPGDPQNGRAIVVSREKGLCLLCHSGPFPEERTPGTLSTDLAGTGSRWSEAQLRLRVADARALNPDSLMPSFHKPDAGERVAAGLRGQPILSGQEVEDVVSFLKTLR